MYKRLNKNINRHVKKKKSEKKITITITERNQANLHVLILNVGYIGFTIMKQMGDNEAYPLNALSTCEEPLISAGEGGGLLPRSVLNTASRVSY